MTDTVTITDPRLGEQYTRFQHKSGLTVYVFPKALSTAYALIGTRFGSVDNNFRLAGEAEFTRVPDGVAHFLEHKLFENADGEDTFEKFARTGANANAYTDFCSTAYLFSCTEELYPSLEILLRSVFSPYFTPENVQKEQGIIAQEIRMGEDEPYNVLQYGMLRGLYKEHSVRIDIAGTVPSILTITPEILYRCHAAFYNPANMVLCVCGKATTERVCDVVDSVLSEATPLTVESIYAKETPEAYRARVTRHMEVSKPLFCIGVKDTDIASDPDERQQKDLAMQLIAAIGFGRSSEFYHELIDEGLISPNFETWVCHNAAFSFFSLLGDTEDPEAVFRRFSHYVATGLHDALCEENLDRCRRAMYASFIKTFDSTEEIANTLAVDFALEGYDLFSYGDRILQISVEELRAVAASLFRPEAFTLSTVLPRTE
ncbi:MAG: insulinase family protein [Ruminococcaceae bacterium]|nr:insulinase family protein [Oscillospiraceae bacterium]